VWLQGKSKASNRIIRTVADRPLLEPLFVPAPQIFPAGALIGADRQINLDSSHVDSSSIVGEGRGATADEPARLVSFLLFKAQCHRCTDKHRKTPRLLTTNRDEIALGKVYR
jgi:hypothetical protein